MQSILDATEATDFRTFIKGTGNFRDSVAKTRVYKGNRDTSHRPAYERDIRQYLKDYWKAEEVDGMEADDAVAIAQCGELFTHSEEIVHDPDTIICSPDKDLLQVPGWHYNYNTGEKFWITEDEANLFFYKQLLTGDASDNIVGVPRLGARKAERTLEGCTTTGEMYERVKAAYQEAYKEKAEETLLEMAQLLYIKRTPEDMWKPPM